MNTTIHIIEQLKCSLLMLKAMNIKECKKIKIKKPFC